MLSGSFIVDGQVQAVGFQQLTSLSSSTALTVPSSARLALIQASVQNVRWRDDGTNPTASVGNVITADSILWYTADPRNLKFIEETSGAKLNVSYYK